MGLDHDHDLVLGLGLTSPKIDPIDHNLKPKKPTNFEPSLTLGLSGETFAIKKCDHAVATSHKIDCEASEATDNLYHHHSHSAVSSFSNVSVKRERDFGGEEAEVERVSSRVSEEDDDGANARKKLRLTKEQSTLLEESFKLHSTLNPKQKQALAKQLSLRPRQVEVWFQNRRARTKLKQTEVDCELLRKCCETLTDENRRLQKEVQELKALKVSQPLYMHMPAATLTMCPSCERIGGGVGEAAAAASKSPYLVAPKTHHFYNPFTNPSAAC